MILSYVPDEIKEGRILRSFIDSSSIPDKVFPPYKSTIDKVRRGIGRLIDSYQEGLLEKSDFEPRIRKAKERLKNLEANLEKRASEEEQRKSLCLVIGRMRDFAETVVDGLEHADWLTRRAIIRAVVKRIEIDEEEVRIIYKISPGPVGGSRQTGSLQYCWRVITPPWGTPASG